MDHFPFPGSYRESLQAENDFLKMKLMLEKGAVFGSVGSCMATPEEEHAFLQSVIEMEAIFEGSEMVTIYERTGRPAQFKPVDEISDQAIDTGWNQLNEFLRFHGIVLSVGTPFVSNRELYRFVTEEFFQVEIEACEAPGVVSVFYYDYFHPDPFYENTETALRSCMTDVLTPDAKEGFHYLVYSGIRLNQSDGLTIEEYIHRVRSFQGMFEHMEILALEESGCRVYESESTVSGHYSLKAISGGNEYIYSGKWTVTFVPDNERYFWYVSKVMVEGLPL